MSAERELLRVLDAIADAPAGERDALATEIVRLVIIPPVGGDGEPAVGGDGHTSASRVIEEARWALGEFAATLAGESPSPHRGGLCLVVASVVLEASARAPEWGALVAGARAGWRTRTPTGTCSRRRSG